MTQALITGKMSRAEIDAALEAPNLARLATTDPATCQPHVVPVWFGWDGQSLWISSYSNTRKIKELKANAKCAILIDTAEKDGAPWGILMEGEAELVREPKDWLREKIIWVYTRYLGPEGILAPAPQEWIADPHNLLIKLSPQRIMSW
jgi:nitroimidazol reductase NimA-like FMN-containing flavoprotein (pyridoxamine 5'-phosphate oxidase superfamily)